MKHAASYIALSLLAIALWADTNTAPGTSTEKYLRHATTYYWLGVNDKGDPKAFLHGLEYLQKARNSLIAYEATGDDDVIKKHAEMINMLQTDMEEQLIIAYNNFAGTFPLVRFIGEPVFIRSDAFGSFEIATPPGELASTKAVNAIGKTVNQGLWGDAQLPMFVFSKDDSLPDMESATRVIFKHWHRVKAYEKSHLKRIIDFDEVSGYAHADLAEPAMKALGSSFVAFTSIELKDKVDDVLFYRFTCNIFVKGRPDPAQTIIHYELVRDKRDMASWLAAMLMSFLILSFLAFYLLNLRNADYKPRTASYFLLPFLSWLTGIISTMVTLSLLAAIKPAHQEYITYAFWWTPLTFLSAFFASIILVRKIIALSSWLKNYKGNPEESASLYLISSFGITTVMSIGLILYHDTQSLPYIITNTYLFGISAYAMGNVLNKFNPRPLASALPLIVFIPFAAVVIAGNYNLLHLLVVILLTAGLHAHYIYTRKTASGIATDLAIDESGESDTKLSNIDEFIKRVNNSPYFETSKLSAMLSRFEHFGGHGNITCIVGKDGVGKTATANEIIRRLKLTSRKGDDSGFLVLKGNGEKQTGGASPYFAIRQALKGFFGTSQFENTESTTDEFDQLLDGVFKNVVPFSGLLFPDQKKTNPTVSSQEELYYSLAFTLKNLSKQKEVVLFIDDLHWLDDATIDLLKYLHDFFQDKKEFPVHFLYTTRADEKIRKMFEAEQIVEIPVFSKSDYFDFLTRNFNLEANSARLIMKWVSGQVAGKGNMFWLFKILDLLAKGGHLKKAQEDKFALSEELLLRQKLPIPEEYRLTIREELIKLDSHKKIIGLAAVMGIQFDAFLVAKGLEIDKLRCLEALDMIERESNLVYDVTSKDGIFSFRSSFTLETIRLELGIFESGKRHGNLKQIIKEYNAIVATVYEQEMPESEVLKIASCYSNAGNVYAKKAVPACMKAADYCMKLFRYDEARNYIKMAEECLDHYHDRQNAEIELTVLKIRITTSEGKTKLVSEDCCEKILKHADSLSITQLSYFAHYYYHFRVFEKGLELGRKILEKASDLYEKALGFFWEGLCLPGNAMNDKIVSLENALRTLSEIKKENIKALKLKSRVLNSIGELYSSLANSDKKYKSKAREYLLESIRLKNRDDILDRSGLAHSYGGLGRLELFVEPVDPVKALNYFEKDLELSEITGDHKGQVKMHSFIGACHFLIKNYELAAKAYKQSFKLSTDPVDSFYALLGLLELSFVNKEFIDGEKTTRRITTLIQNNDLPTYCLLSLKKLQIKYPDKEQFMTFLSAFDQQT